MKQQVRATLHTCRSVLSICLLTLAPLAAFAGGANEIGIGELGPTQHTRFQGISGFASVFPDGSWSVFVHGMAPGTYVFSVGTSGTYRGDVALGTVRVDSTGYGSASGVSNRVPAQYNIMRIRAAAGEQATGGTLLAAFPNSGTPLTLLVPWASTS